MEHQEPDHKSGAVQENSGHLVAVVIDECGDESQNVHVDNDAVERQLLK